MSQAKNYSKYSIGGWYYTSEFENTATGIEKTEILESISVENNLIHPEDTSDKEGLALFGRIGIANSSFNPSDYSVLGE